jgi:hypothetical protein
MDHQWDGLPTDGRCMDVMPCHAMPFARGRAILRRVATSATRGRQRLQLRWRRCYRSGSSPEETKLDATISTASHRIAWDLRACDVRGQPRDRLPCRHKQFAWKGGPCLLHCRSR